MRQVVGVFLAALLVVRTCSIEDEEEEGVEGGGKGRSG